MNSQGKKLSKCEMCESIFANDNSYVCAVCSNSFDQSSCLVKHFFSHTSKKTYNCDTCQECFESEDKLAQHKLCHSKREIDIICKECNKTFQSQHSYKLHSLLHMVMNSKISIYTCPLCYEKFEKRRDLNIHLSEHSVKGPLSCEICHKSFRSLSWLIDHQDRFHAGNHICDICTKSFSSLGSLATHKRRHAFIRRSRICPDCGITYINPNAFASHRLRHIYSRFTCKLCPSRFRSEKRYLEHCNFHKNSESGTFPCGECGKDLHSRASQRAHEIVHHTDKYKCSFCRKVFMSAKHLAGHCLRIHNSKESQVVKERFSCKLCDKKDMLHAAYRYHMLMKHTKGIHKCQLCGKIYVSRQKYQDHMKLHADPIALKCQICNKTFPSCQLLKSHCLSHTGELPYECDYCGSKFQSNQKQKAHLRRCKKRVEMECKKT